MLWLTSKFLFASIMTFELGIIFVTCLPDPPTGGRGNLMSFDWKLLTVFSMGCCTLRTILLPTNKIQHCICKKHSEKKERYQLSPLLTALFLSHRQEGRLQQQKFNRQGKGDSLKKVAIGFKVNGLISGEVWHAYIKLGKSLSIYF